MVKMKAVPRTKVKMTTEVIQRARRDKEIVRR